MYDALTTSYRFACPSRGKASVRLSRFRRLEELPGPHHPTVYRVDFACACGQEHPGLVTHDELDWAPLGLDAGTSWVNLMTSRRDLLATELSDLAARHIRAGDWPWSFFCWPEERARPVFPSSFLMLTESGRNGVVGVAVLCPVCARVSVNLVSHEHVDVPFHNDREVGVVATLFESPSGDALVSGLEGACVDVRRLPDGPA